MRALALIALSAFSAHATTLAEIDAAAKQTRTLTAEFQQTSKVKLFKQVLTQKGKLAFVAPRKIRWDYVTPDPSTLVLDGDKAVMRSPGAAAQTFDLAKDATMGAIFEQLVTFVGGGSLTNAESAYVITPGDRQVTLVPKPSTPADKVFSRIVISFDKKLTVEKIDLLEKSGDQKLIVFNKVVRNGTVPDTLFAQ